MSKYDKEEGTRNRWEASPQLIRESQKAIRKGDIHYINRIPNKPLPEGRVLVDNHVSHTRDMPSGVMGFRFWTQKVGRDLVRCTWGWHGVPHYRVRGMGGAKCYTRKQLEVPAGPLRY